MQIVKVSYIIDAPIHEVWAITSSFGVIQTWMPGVERVGIEGAGIGAVRTVTSWLGVVQERLDVLDPAAFRVRYAFLVPGLDHIKDFSGGTDLSAVTPNRTKIDWVAEASSIKGDIGDLPAGLETFIHGAIAGLAGLLGVESERV